MAIKKVSIIGDDPLSWMKDECSERTEDGLTSAGSVCERRVSEAGGNSHPVHNEDNEKYPEETVSEITVELNDGDPLEDTVSDHNPASPLVLESSLGVAFAGKLYEGLKPLLEQKSGVDIDASKVETVDACGLQLLLGFVRSAKQQNIPVRWKQASAKFVEAAEQKRI